MSQVRKRPSLARQRSKRRTLFTTLAVVLLALTAGALACAAWSLFNLSAQRSYESTSAQLRRNITAARRGTQSVPRLRASQRAVSGNLDDLASSTGSQALPLARAVETSRATSHRFDRVLARMASGKNWRQATHPTPRHMGPHPKPHPAPRPAQQQEGAALQKEQESQEAKERRKFDQLVHTQSSTNSTLKPW